jgi:putative membrane protein insertion efficiency factor
MSIFSKIVISLIKTYQKTIGKMIGEIRGHATCRFIPTCSEYTVLAIQKYGIIKGLYLGAKRVLRCHPWSKQRVDFP